MSSDPESVKPASAFVPHFPHHFGVCTPGTLQSYDRDDELRELGEKALKVLSETSDIYREYAETGAHELVTAENSLTALQATDHTTLRDTRNEDRNYMTRMGDEASNVVPMRAVCTWPDFGQDSRSDKLGPLADFLSEYPDVGLAVVLNYPHGDWGPEKSAKAIYDVADFFAKKNLKNPLDVDTVADYAAWMDGDFDTVEAVLKAESEATQETGLFWKLIFEVSVHAMASRNKNYGSDYMRSVFDMGVMAGDNGVPCFKTSTGLAAKPPFHDFVPKDTGPIYRALAMIVSLADYNQKNGTEIFPKFSGGNESEVDAAVLRYATRELAGDAIAEKAIFGTSPRFRHQLLQSVLNEMGDKAPFSPKLLEPYGFNAAQVLAKEPGLPDPRAVKQSHDYTPQFIQGGPDLILGFE